MTFAGICMGGYPGTWYTMKISWAIPRKYTMILMQRGTETVPPINLSDKNYHKSPQNGNSPHVLHATFALG
jgi:hypothetical protein